MNRLFKFFFALTFVISFTSKSVAQDKYPSLLWEISGNGLEKPSYIFGTMHVSNKIAFRLGSPFFKALENVDLLALELEPELWFDEVLSGDFINQSMNYAYGFYGKSGSWNEYSGKFDVPTNYEMKLQGIFKSNPSTINSLLYRLNDFNANFEENTWLDMYIYQSAKKLKKETIGLETFKESMDMQIKASQDKKDNYTYYEYSKDDQLSYEERLEINQKIEDAYRNGNLDLLDSLTILVSEPSFRKYIIDERNVKFMEGIDSLLQQKSIFVAVGASHLPGEKGCIEMIRDLGYTVKPISMGKKDGKQKKKLDDMFIKRPLTNYTSEDGVVSFQSPYNTYQISFETGSMSFVTMDITNGLTFVVNRIALNTAFSGITAESAAASFEKFMYETVPGEIVSTKKIESNGIKGFEVYNETRRGDIQRNHIYFCGDEVIVARLSASGKKIKQGAGDYFFNDFKIDKSAQNTWCAEGLKDGSMLYHFPTRPLTYAISNDNKVLGECFLQSTDTDGNLYGIFRIKGSERGFLDEEKYELSKLENAFRNDLELEVLDSSFTDINLSVKYDKFNGKHLFANFELVNLSYHVAFVMTNDEQRAKEFFSNTSFQTPNVEQYYPMTDSLLFFKTKVDWEQKENDFKSLVYMAMGSGMFSGEDKEDYTKQYTRNDTYSSPYSNEQVMVRYEREGKYNRYFDKTYYKENEIERITEYGDLIVVDSSWSWDGNDYVAEFWLTDTLSNRGYHSKEIFHNRALHSIRASYDVDLGESGYVKTFIENFEPLEDTLNTTSYFESSKDIFIEDLMSEDSSVFFGAESNFKNLYHLFERDERLEIYRLIAEGTPPLVTDEDEEEFERRLTHYFYLDQSDENIAKLKEDYYAFSDSASYQELIIENLMAMDTKKGMMAAKELLLEEPPIGSQVNPFNLSDRLLDSMELGALFYPEILELTAYEEYQHSWINALAALVDSGAIKKEVYKKQVFTLLNEAKVELKRLASSEEGSKKNSYYYDDYYYGSGDLNFSTDYWSLLYPYRNSIKEVSDFLEKVKNAKKKHVQLEYAYFIKDHGEELDDEFYKSLLPKIITFEEYKTFKELDKLELLPDTLNIEKMAVETDIKEAKYGYYYGDREVDTIIPIDNYELTIRNRDYTVLQYKYQVTKNDETQWFGVMAMIEQGSFEKGDFYYIYEEREAKKEDLDDEFFEELHYQLIDDNRQNNYGGYNYRGFDFGGLNSLLGL